MSTTARTSTRVAHPHRSRAASCRRRRSAVTSASLRPRVRAVWPQQVEGGSARKGGGTSAFAGSTQSRGASSFSAPGANVGPGSYDTFAGSIEQKLSGTANPRSPAFGSSSVRAGPGGRSMSPSPGAYDAAQSETLSARSGKSFNTSASMGKASFGTFSKRDKKLGASEGGDPGAYTVENPGVNSGKAEPSSRAAGARSTAT